MLDKIKYGFLLIALLLLSGCFSGSKTRLFGGAPVAVDNTNNTVAVNEVNFIDLLNDGSISDIESLDVYKLIKSRQSIFILTNKDNAIDEVYANNICDNVNNNLTNSRYVCLAQGIKNFYQDAPEYITKSHSSPESKQLFSANFLVTRLDYLINKQKDNSGPLAKLPDLDMVMFLNGNYLYLWGDYKYNATELTKELESFKNKGNNNKIFRVAAANELAKEIVIKVLEANDLSVNVQVDIININNSNNNKNNYQVVAYAGNTISEDMNNYIAKYYRNYVPLGLTDSVIDKTISKNKEFSTYNVASYYTTEGLLRNINIKNSKINKSKSSNVKKEDENTGIKDRSNFSGNNEEIPAFTGKRLYDQTDFSNSKFDFNVNTVPEILKTDTIVNPANANVNTIGIPNVLVATRKTDNLEVYNILYSFIEKHNFIKSNYITKDMRTFKISDLITSSLKNNNLIYSYGVINLLSYYQDVNGKATMSESLTEAVNTIKENIKSVNVPPLYGPNIPNPQQVDAIKYQNKRRIAVNQEIKSIEALKNIIDNIQSDINKDQNTKDDNLSLLPKVDDSNEHILDSYSQSQDFNTDKNKALDTNETPTGNLPQKKVSPFYDTNNYSKDSFTLSNELN